MEATHQTSRELLRIESFGVRVDIRILREELRPKILALLPPGWREVGEEDAFAEARFGFLTTPMDRVVVLDGPKSLSAVPLDLDVALSFLEWRIRGVVARWAPDHIFVRAGVVVRDGRALLLPGGSFSGKTTLVAALVDAGATYYSDEYAVLDEEGFVHPYRKPLVRPADEGEPSTLVAGEPDGTGGGERARVSTVVFTSYVPGADWAPSVVSRGEAALSLLSHTAPAQERPAEVLRVLRHVVEGAACVQGDRGEAEAVVSPLLSLLEGADPDKASRPS